MESSKRDLQPLHGKFRDEDCAFEPIPADVTDRNQHESSYGLIALDTSQEAICAMLDQLTSNQFEKIAGHIKSQIERDYAIGKPLNLDTHFKTPLLKCFENCKAAEAKLELFLEKYNKLYEKELAGKMVNIYELISLMKEKKATLQALLATTEINHIDANLTRTNLELLSKLTQHSLLKNYLLREVKTNQPGILGLIAWAICTKNSLRIWQHRDDIISSKEIHVAKHEFYISSENSNEPIDILYSSESVPFKKLYRVSATHKKDEHPILNTHFTRTDPDLPFLERVIEYKMFFAMPYHQHEILTPIQEELAEEKHSIKKSPEAYYFHSWLTAGEGQKFQDEITELSSQIQTKLTELQAEKEYRESITSHIGLRNNGIYLFDQFCKKYPALREIFYTAAINKNGNSLLDRLHNAYNMFLREREIDIELTKIPRFFKINATTAESIPVKKRPLSITTRVTENKRTKEENSLDTESGETSKITTKFI